MPCMMFNQTVPTELHKVYTIVEVVCAVVSFFGNLLVLIAFSRFRRVRSVTNYYVISLAVADLLVAVVGIPSALATSVGLPRHFRLCLFMNSILMLLVRVCRLSRANSVWPSIRGRLLLQSWCCCALGLFCRWWLSLWIGSGQLFGR